MRLFIWPAPCSLEAMTNFAATVPHAYNGKHNMASDAFQALRDARAKGEPTNSMSFNDLIDTINPLQHIPVVSTIYRDLTGDKISNQARIAGGALYGGVIGLAVSMLNSAVDMATGEDIGGHVMATLFGSDTPSADNKTTRVAANTSAPTAADAALITGSITPKKPSPKATASTVTNKPAQPLPQLSPEAFNALIGSFADPEAAKKANAALAREVARTAQPAATPLAPEKAPEDIAAPAPAPVPANDIASKMNQGLNELHALKAAQAKSLSLSATTNGLAGTSTSTF